MSFEIQGKLIVKKDTRQVSDSFRVREFVLEVARQVGENTYLNPIQFQVTQDRCDLLDSIEVNEELKLSFDIRGREWTSPQGETKYFNSMDAWRVERVSAHENPFANEAAAAPAAAEASQSSSSSEEDLPF